MKKSFRLYKREPGTGRELPQFVPDPANPQSQIPNPKIPRDGHYYFKFEFRGTTYARCLETNDAADAQAKARTLHKQITEKVKAGELEQLESTKIRSSPTSTLNELFTIYLREARISSARQNVAVMRTLIRRVHGTDLTDSAIAGLRTNIFTEDFWTTVQDSLVPAGLPEGEAKRTATTNLHSLIGQARSIFRRNLLAVYQKNKIKFPASFIGFLAWQPAYEEPAHHFQRIPAALLKTLQEKAVAELKPHNVNAYRAWLLGRYVGLRRAEIARACWSHIFLDEQNSEAGHIQYAIHLDRTKNGKPRNAPIEKAVYDELVSLTKVLPMPSQHVIDPGAPFDAEAADYILEGPWKARYETAGDDVADWMKRNGWKRKKKLHELRKQVGTEIADAHGTRIGAAVLGNTEKVFAAHYDAPPLPKVKLFGT